MGYMAGYQISEDMRARLDNDYTYHAPNDSQIERYQSIRDSAKAFAELIVCSCPPSRELSLALASLEASVMQANAAIARHE